MSNSYHKNLVFTAACIGMCFFGVSMITLGAVLPSLIAKLNLSGLQTTSLVTFLPLGMQLMCRFSEEENTWGLGIFPMEVKKFTDSCKVPHMGWNTVRKLKTTLFQGINPGEWMYFVHSYYVPVLFSNRFTHLDLVF